MIEAAIALVLFLVFGRFILGQAGPAKQRMLESRWEFGRRNGGGS
ncbi:hypothetical protein [Tautonia plasticadhaerens]|uniref:Uncharacterized protein n=1 Tax=Tautonia plasticadhaerens TaxID=2527974 RepID=A0A518H2D4_9BACT|nr:hypothetical protein [Tautonia plasticadhaerens]QDV34998.1 hypothetical protein ElP_28950 [Tautonia plasticadhaerens]